MLDDLKADGGGDPAAHHGLRLALDVGPVHGQPAGVGMYAASLAAALGDELRDSLALIGVRRETPTLDGVHAGARMAFRSRNYHSWLQLFADRQARRVGASLAHYTNAAAPLVSRLPYVLTVHDLSLMSVPGTHPLARRATLPVSLLAIARARAIIVPSTWTRRELMRLRVSPSRVIVVGHAPAELPAVDAGATAQVLARLELGKGKFILSVGTLEPRKNQLRLIEAFERVATDRPGLRLVLVGAPGWHYGPIVERARSSPLADRIVLAGYLPSADLAALTRAAGACAYVSIYEGYGMPVIDAMALGAAVVTSNRSAMPEAAGGAAVLVDPFDVASIARGLARALDERASLAERGRRRAAGRTWSDAAREHLDVYRWTLQRGRGAGT